MLTLTTSLAALPTVTADRQASPGSVPTARSSLDLISTRPTRSRGRRRSIQVLRSLMADTRCQVLGPTDDRRPVRERRGPKRGTSTIAGTTSACGWSTTSTRRSSGSLSRIRELLDAGWKRVDVVTDHGWILLPGGMEKVELPAATTEIKKGRCARLKDGAAVDVPTVPWFWDQDVRIALAPGVTCFEAEQGVRARGRKPAGVRRSPPPVTAGAAGESHYRARRSPRSPGSVCCAASRSVASAKALSSICGRCPQTRRRASPRTRRRPPAPTRCRCSSPTRS